MATRGYPLASIPSAKGLRNRIPLLFQVLSIDDETPLLPEAMFLHVNPKSMGLTYTKNVERFQTRGGWQEQHFGEQLTSINVDVSTGAFINVESGLAVSNRRETIAYEKFEHLKQLFHNNGLVYDTNGTVQYRGKIRLMFEGGVFDGSFRDFSVAESASSPFQFTASFTFKVEKESTGILI